jgi:DNA primase
MSLAMTDDLPDIVMVLEHYGAVVRRTSGQINIKCPFHDDSHASASFNTRENIFNCFACGMQGNSLQVISKREGVNLREAKRIAEGIVGTSSTEVSSQYLSGRRLPKKQGNHNRSSAFSALRSGT